MMMEDNIFNCSDKEMIKKELKRKKPKIPCNIWGYIKDLEERITKLEKRR